MTDRTFSPVKIKDLKPGDVVLFRHPMFNTRTVVKVGEHYSPCFDDYYYKITFGHGMEMTEESGEDVVYASRDEVAR